MTTMLALLRQHGLKACAGIAACVFAAGTLAAQAPAPRITRTIDASQRVTLQTSLSPFVRSSRDLGAVDDSTPVEHMRLVLTRAPEQAAALDQFLAEVQQKSSPNYHQWLTPLQFGKRFGPADSDIAALVAWLQQQGFSGIAVPPGRTTVEFSGTAGQVRSAFGVSMHSYVRGSRQFLSNNNQPSIPAAISTVVSGIAHLDTYGLDKYTRPGPLGSLNVETHKLEPASAQPKPDLTTGGSLYMVPGDAATIYNTPNTAFNANYTTGTSYSGSGVTIGIIGDAYVSTTPISNYRSRFLGESSPVLPTISGTATDTSDADEAYLDLEISGGLAPSAALHFYTGNDGSLETQIASALSDNTVDILSVSFGLCELYMTTSQNATYYGYWQQAAAQGIAVTVSTGDNGSAGCDALSTNNVSTTTAKSGLAVSGLATSPYNIAIGGTDFALTSSSFSTYVSSTSGTLYRTALGYIPERTWNDSTQNDTTLSANVPWASTSTTITPNIVAGSGGKSSCSTNTTANTLGTCTSGYPKPSWQRGTGVPSDSARDIPDVSLMAGVSFYGAWLVCTNDSSNGITGNCGTVTSSGGSTFYFYGFGGTSAAAPAFAGILALVQQSQGGGRLGQAGINLYNLYNNSASAGSIFHDITVGNNSVPCTSSTTNCAQNTAGNNYLTGYDTTAGYDYATGLGSVNAAQLVAHWAEGQGTAVASVTVSPASSANVANALNVPVSVAGTSGVATGSVVLSSGTYTSAATDLKNGSTTIIVPANSLAVGTDTLTAQYSGDGVYAAATGTAQITIDSTALTTTTTALVASNTTPTYGASVTFTATVAPTAASGSVSFYDSSTLLGTSNLSSGVATFSTSALAVGAHSVTAVYSGDTTYASSTSNIITLSVAAAATGSFTLSATNVTVSQGSSGSSTVTVTPSNGYTGAVTFQLGTSDTTIKDNACYTFTNATVTGTSAVTTTITLYTSASVCASVGVVKRNAVHRFAAAPAASTRTSTPLRKALPAGAAFLGCLVLLGFRKRARVITLLGCLLLLASAGLVTACGGGSSSGGGGSSNKVAKGSYTLTVYGTDTVNSAITATTNFTLTVQ